MNIQNKIDENKELIYRLALDIKKKIKEDLDMDEIITIILIIILVNFPGIKTPKDINTLLIRIFNNKEKINDIYKIEDLPYNIMIESPVMSIENYFTLMKEQLENIHSAPKIIPIVSNDFLHDLSKNKITI